MIEPHISQSPMMIALLPWAAPKLGWYVYIVYRAVMTVLCSVAGPSSYSCSVAGTLSSPPLRPVLGVRPTPDNFRVGVSVVVPEIA